MGPCFHFTENPASLNFFLGGSQNREILQVLLNRSEPIIRRISESIWKNVKGQKCTILFLLRLDSLKLNWNQWWDYHLWIKDIKLNLKLNYLRWRPLSIPIQRGRRRVRGWRGLWRRTAETRRWWTPSSRCSGGSRSSETI